MKVLWYQSLPADHVANFSELLAKISIDYDCRVVDSISALEKFLKQPGERPQAAVMLVADHGELEQLINICNELNGMRTIILLPDLESDTIGSALGMRPSFYASHAAPPEVVRSVLDKIATHT